MTKKAKPQYTECVQCGSDLPAGLYADAKYCGHKCRMKAYRRRKGLNPRQSTPGQCSSCGKHVEAKTKLAKGRCITCYIREVYYPKHRKKMLAYKNARRAHMKVATPPWADMDEIDEFYRECPEGHHVDHIVPLRGSTVSGLHVRENLQYLPAHENQQKSNRFHQPVD